MLETLFFAEDVRSKEEIEEAVSATEVEEAELELADQVISEPRRASGTPKSSRTTTGKRAAGDARGEAAGQEIKRPEPAPETPVVDLMEALRRSVEEVQARKAPAKKASNGSGRRKTAATRKSA